MDIVIPLHEWSGTDNAELRYALRSFEKFMPHDRVVLIGFAPKWVRNIIHIPFRDDNQPAFREANIFLKLECYLKSETGKDQEKFIYANDDHFLMKLFNPAPPYPFKGTLLESFNKRGPDDPYRKTIDNTIKISSNKDYDFDVHAPMQMDRDHFFESFKGDRVVNWATKFGYLLKSLYGNYMLYNNESEAYRVLDLKIMQASDKSPVLLLDELRAADLSFFTTSDQAFNENMAAMFELYLPDKSKYEK